MIGFALNDKGDISIENNQIQMINDAELTRQTIQSIISTNKGEWPLNDEEGITYDNILGKHTDDEEAVQDEIEQGIQQVDENLSITDFNFDFDSNTRKLKINFKAENENGEEIYVENEYD